MVECRPDHMQIVVEYYQYLVVVDTSGHGSPLYAAENCEVCEINPQVYPQAAQQVFRCATLVLRIRVGTLRVTGGDYKPT